VQTHRPVMDIHSHTRYSSCGRDEPGIIVEAALAAGVELFGISDHSYGIGARTEAYKAEIAALRDAYAGRIRILTGIEIATLPGFSEPEPERFTDFDYCLLEHIDRPETTVGTDVFAYRKRFDGRFGIAHTDLISMARSLGLAPMDFLRRFAENDIFWEMNVNYDSIHHYRQHEYVLRFLRDEAEQAVVRASGIRLSVGFDGHRTEDYLPDRILSMNTFLLEHDFPVVEF